MSKCMSTYLTTQESEYGYTPVPTYTSSRVIEHVLTYSLLHRGMSDCLIQGGADAACMSVTLA